MSILKQFDTLTAVREALAKRQFSVVELATETLDEIKRQRSLNAFLDIQPELTLAQAKAADQLIQNGQATPLTGLTLAHKDVLVTKGWKTTAASKMLANYVSPFDATVVEKLANAGTVTFGKLNCDEFAMGSHNENSAFGAVKNPWDTSRTPGGSSGGSAAAVAAGLVLAATGTDTGGSVRQPAAMCGVSGIKPTYGTVSRYGLVTYGASLDQAGPIARTANDLVELLDTISGHDPRDGTSLKMCGSQTNAPGRIKQQFKQHQAQFQENSKQPLKGIRIGVPTEFFADGLSEDVATAVEAALAKFESLGAQRVEISLPHTRLSVPAYYVIAPAEASSNLARYDGVRYGHRATEYTDIHDMMRRSRTEGFGPEVIRRILIGTYVLRDGYYDAYYLQAQKVRQLIATDFATAFDQHCDVIMGPVSAETAPLLNQKNSNPTSQWLSDIYTLGVSLAGLPAMSIPCGFSSASRPLPIGLQIIGNHFSEALLLALANCFQENTDWHQRKPEII